MHDFRLLNKLFSNLNPGDVIHVPSDENGEDTYYFLLQKNEDNTFYLGRSQSLSIEDNPVIIVGCGLLKIGEDGVIYCNDADHAKIRDTRNLLQVAKVDKYDGLVMKDKGKDALQRFESRTPGDNGLTEEKYSELLKKLKPLINKISEINDDDRLRKRTDIAKLYLEILDQVKDAEEKQVILAVINAMQDKNGHSKMTIIGMPVGFGGLGLGGSDLLESLAEQLAMLKIFEKLEEESH